MVKRPERALTTETWVAKRSALAVESFEAGEPVEDAFGMIEGIRRVEVASDTKKGDVIPPSEESAVNVLLRA